MTQPNRRDVLRAALAAAAIGMTDVSGIAAPAVPSKMRLGLVTYNWGKDWDLPTLLENCEATGFEGVELRSTHKHGVEITLDHAERRKVAARFADSPVECVGLGSACEYHSADPAELARNIQETKAFIELCHDIGGSGVKVRPNGLPQDVPEDRTLEQIGQSLNEVGKYGADYGVAIRLEVHGHGTAEIPRIKRIMDVADHPNVVVCWNCNPQDLQGQGLEANFQMLQERIGTIHIHDLRSEVYPWDELFRLLQQADFEGWTLLEDGKMPEDIVGAMKENREVWNRLVSG